MDKMKELFRGVVFSSIAGLLLVSFSGSLMADSQQDSAKAECMAEAQESGLEGAELKQFIQECVAGSAEQEGAQPQQ
jgi:hypothetical protein